LNAGTWYNVAVTNVGVRRTLALLEELHGPCRLVEADRVNLTDLLAECEREWREANVKKKPKQ
jgi:hypothetical protein